MHDLTADLPPPRDDEPASLRQDIVDELADHLECALRRELLASGRPEPCETASGDSSFRPEWQRVLTRFGNPAAIARRLWLDAMKEKLMAQRIMTAASLIAAVAACVLVLFIWRSMDADRQVVMASLDANRDLISQLNATNGRLMDQLDLSRQKLEQLSAGGSQHVEWVPYEVTVRKGDLAGPPAEGVEVQLTLPSFGGGGAHSPKALPQSAKTDENGVADLGLVYIGTYSLRLKTPWGEHYDESITVYPGKPITQTIVCPAQLPDPIDVALQVQWPDGFEHDDIWVVFWGYSLTRQHASMTWSPYNAMRPDISSEPASLLINPEGQMELRKPRRRDQTAFFDAVEHKIQVGTESVQVKWLDDTNLQPINEYQLPDAVYRFSNVSFLIRVDGVADVPTTGGPWVAYVPDTYRDDARESFELREGDPPQLTLKVPREVIAKIRDFRTAIRPDEQAAANDLQ